MDIWAGLGMRTGGRVLVGLDKTIGVIYCLGDPLQQVRWAYLLGEGVSVGFALGGGVGLVLILAWGYKQSSDIDETEVAEFDPVLDVGVKGTGGYLRSIYDVGKGGRAYKYAGKIAQFAEDFEHSKQFVEAFIKNLKNVVNVSKPGVVILPIPGAGAGIEVAIALRASNVRATQSALVNIKDSAQLKLHLENL